MSRYVSPILKIEFIDVEDILLTSGEDVSDEEKNENETTGRPINPTSTIDAMNYFN